MEQKPACRHGTSCTQYLSIGISDCLVMKTDGAQRVLQSKKPILVLKALVAEFRACAVCIPRTKTYDHASRSLRSRRLAFHMSAGFFRGRHAL